MKFPVDSIIGQWNNVGDEYWKNRSLRQKWLPDYVLNPEIFRIVKTISHKSILDYGCGDGQLADFLLKQFPESLIFAYDSSVRMRDAARQVIGYDRVLESMDGMQFEVICINMVIQDISDPVKMLLDLKPHLSSTGKIIITIPHPIFALRECDHLTTRREILNGSGLKGYDRYLSEETEKVFWNTEDDTNWTYLFNRTIQTYSSFFDEAGLTIELIRETLPEERGICEQDLYLVNSELPHSMVFCLCVRK